MVEWESGRVAPRKRRMPGYASVPTGRLRREQPGIIPIGAGSFDDASCGRRDPQEESR